MVAQDLPLSSWTHTPWAMALLDMHGIPSSCRDRRCYPGCSADVVPSYGGAPARPGSMEQGSWSCNFHSIGGAGQSLVTGFAGGGSQDGSAHLPARADYYRHFVTVRLPTWVAVIQDSPRDDILAWYVEGLYRCQPEGATLIVRSS